MSEDEYQTAKIVAERLRDYLLDLAKRAMAPDNPKDMLKSPLLIRRWSSRHEASCE